MAGIQKAAPAAPNTNPVAEILAAPDWSDVVLTDHKKFWALAATFAGNRYSQTGKDPVVLAATMNETARATVLPPRKVEAPKPEPEPAPVAPLGYEDEAPEADEGEPLPDPLARLIPETVEQAKRKEWLRDRHVYLSHLINGASTFGPPSDAVVREHQELERYRGFFA